MRSARYFKSLLLLLPFLGVLGFGQGLTSVTGLVTDQIGAVIPGAEVTITNTATRISRSVVTNDAGVYGAAQLPPGIYDIKVEVEGFRPKLVNNIALPVNDVVTLHLALIVGSLTDVVDVTASTEVINTVNGQLGVGFDEKKIIDLPLNARNVIELLALQTGVSANLGNADDSGFVNGARNDQQNIVLDGVDVNTQQAGAAFTAALPMTLDSIQEFIVQTSGQSAQNGRSSGAQVQLVTKSGSNEFHGSAYETFRSRATSARNYFFPTATGLIRHIPGGSLGGPIVRDKLFFFGSYERRTDRSEQQVNRIVPTPEFLNGQVRYLRTQASQATLGRYGTLSDGCGGSLEKITMIACDTFNKTLIGPAGLFQAYRPFSADPNDRAASADGGANLLMYAFNAPFDANQNVYIARIDYAFNSKNTAYVRGTLNDLAQTAGAETFPGANDARMFFDNSKGFAASLNSVVSATLNNSFTAGLTRQSNNTTGIAAPSYSFGGFSPLVQSTGANRQAINTWNFVDNLSWIQGTHNWQAGINVSLVSNYQFSYSVANLPSFSAAANQTYGDIGTNASTPLHRAVGDAEFANVANPVAVGDALLGATGTLDLFNVGLQFDAKGNLLPQGAPFVRTIRLNQYDFYVQDTWKWSSNVSFNYGIHWGLITPPWEKYGQEVNWIQNLGQRLAQQASTTLNQGQLPLYVTQLAGRANNLPDYYKAALDNWAPRVSLAYTPDVSDGILGTIARKGGQLVIRGGYALSYDHTGGRFAYDAATSGSIGLLTTYAGQSQGFSFDGLGVPRAPRVGGTAANLVLPYQTWPVPITQSFVAAGSAQPSGATDAGQPGGWGSVILSGIDRNIRPPANHLLNLTFSKELPHGLVIEASYVGRLARGLLGQADLASPPNVVDQQSGQDYYGAMKTLFEQYEYTGAPVSSVQPIPWIENVYAGYKNFAQTSAQGFPGTTFASATQAFYAVLNKGLTPGPNAPVVLTNAINFYELATNRHILTTSQAQYFGLFTDISRSNYNSAQFAVRKHFNGGYEFTGNYTLSKSLDTTSQSEAAGNHPGVTNSEGQILDPYHPNLQYARSDFDRRHQFNGNITMGLPFGEGKLIGGNMSPALNRIFGGWELAGIGTVTSGRPWSFTSSRSSFHYLGADLPIPTSTIPTTLTKTPDSTGQSAVYMLPGDAAARVADGASFRTPYPGSPGLARNTATGPGYFNIDAAVAKQVAFKENFKGTFRVEVFNVLNHPNFAIPGNTNVDSAGIGNLGQITSTQGTERQMQFSFRLTF